MLKKQTQNNVDVFEMILKSGGGGYSFTPQGGAKSQPVFASASPSQRMIDENWHEDHHEGQLSVDVIDAGRNLLVVSTMAGAEVDKIEVYIHNDLLTIRGVRNMPMQNDEHHYIHQECYWGRFSRTIVLPVEVKGDSAGAEYKNGVLTIKIPKRKEDSKIEVTIVEE